MTYHRLLTYHPSHGQDLRDRNRKRETEIQEVPCRLFFRAFQYVALCGVKKMVDLVMKNDTTWSLV